MTSALSENDAKIRNNIDPISENDVTDDVTLSEMTWHYSVDGRRRDTMTDVGTMYRNNCVASRTLPMACSDGTGSNVRVQRR